MNSSDAVVIATLLSQQHYPTNPAALRELFSLMDDINEMEIEYNVTSLSEYYHPRSLEATSVHCSSSQESPPLDAAQCIARLRYQIRQHCDVRQLLKERHALQVALTDIRQSHAAEQRELHRLQQENASLRQMKKIGFERAARRTFLHTGESHLGNVFKEDAEEAAEPYEVESSENCERNVLPADGMRSNWNNNDEDMCNEMEQKSEDKSRNVDQSIIDKSSLNVRSKPTQDKIHETSNSMEVNNKVCVCVAGLSPICRSTPSNQLSSRENEDPLPPLPTQRSCEVEYLLHVLCVAREESQKWENQCIALQAQLAEERQQQEGQCEAVISKNNSLQETLQSQLGAAESENAELRQQIHTLREAVQPPVSKFEPPISSSQAEPTSQDVDPTFQEREKEGEPHSRSVSHTSSVAEVLESQLERLAREEAPHGTMKTTLEALPVAVTFPRPSATLLRSMRQSLGLVGKGGEEHIRTSRSMMHENDHNDAHTHRQGYGSGRRREPSASAQQVAINHPNKKNSIAKNMVHSDSIENEMAWHVLYRIVPGAMDPFEASVGVHEGIRRLIPRLRRLEEERRRTSRRLSEVEALAETVPRLRGDLERERRLNTVLHTRAEERADAVMHLKAELADSRAALTEFKKKQNEEGKKCACVNVERVEPYSSSIVVVPTQFKGTRRASRKGKEKSQSKTLLTSERHRASAEDAARLKMESEFASALRELQDGKCLLEQLVLAGREELNHKAQYLESSPMEEEAVESPEMIPPPYQQRQHEQEKQKEDMLMLQTSMPTVLHRDLGHVSLMNNSNGTADRSLCHQATRLQQAEVPINTPEEESMAVIDEKCNETCHTDEVLLSQHANQHEQHKQLQKPHLGILVGAKERSEKRANKKVKGSQWGIVLSECKNEMGPCGDW